MQSAETVLDVLRQRGRRGLHKPGEPQPEWMRIMAKRRRKTLVVCAICHANIHNRQPTAMTA